MMSERALEELIQNKKNSRANTFLDVAEINSEKNASSETAKKSSRINRETTFHEDGRIMEERYHLVETIKTKSDRQVTSFIEPSDVGFQKSTVDQRRRTVVQQDIDAKSAYSFFTGVVKADRYINSRVQPNVCQITIKPHNFGPSNYMQNTPRGNFKTDYKVVQHRRQNSSQYGMTIQIEKKAQRAQTTKIMQAKNTNSVWE